MSIDRTGTVQHSHEPDSPSKLALLQKLDILVSTAGDQIVAILDTLADELESYGASIDDIGFIEGDNGTCRFQIIVNADMPEGGLN